jgi:hypothetical protein
MPHECLLPTKEEVQEMNKDPALNAAQTISRRIAAAKQRMKNGDPVSKNGITALCVACLRDYLKGTQAPHCEHIENSQTCSFRCALGTSVEYSVSKENAVREERER